MHGDRVERAAQIDFAPVAGDIDRIERLLHRARLNDALFGEVDAQQLIEHGKDVVAVDRADHRREQGARCILEFIVTDGLAVEIESQNAGSERFRRLWIDAGHRHAVRRGHHARLFELRPEGQDIGFADARALPVAQGQRLADGAVLRVDDVEIPAHGDEVVVTGAGQQHADPARRRNRAQGLGADAVGRPINGELRVERFVAVRQQAHRQQVGEKILPVLAHRHAEHVLDAQVAVREIGAEHFLAALQLDAGNAFAAVGQHVGDLAVARDRQRGRQAVTGNGYGFHNTTRRRVDQVQLVRPTGDQQIVGRRGGNRKQADDGREDPAQHGQSSGNRVCSSRQSRSAEFLPSVQSRAVFMLSASCAGHQHGSVQP